MSVFGREEAPTTTSRTLRRLAHLPAVPTTYLSREADFAATDAARATAVGEGYAEGYAEGLAQAASDASGIRLEEARRAEEALSGLTRALAAAQASDLRVRAELQAAAPRFAFALLEALLGRELELATNPGREAIARALALDEGSEPARVRLNPGDLDTLDGIGLGRVMSVEPDPSVEPGGALVEVGPAILDGQLGPALERVRQVLLSAVAPGAHDDRAA
jgi:flagellar assembly protein FliH